MSHVYEVRPCKDHSRVDLISDALPFGGLWYGEPEAVSNAIDFAKFYSQSTCRCDLIETHEQAGISKRDDFSLVSRRSSR
jgi:hypothetical protein